MGTPTVMAAKIIWDVAFYWGFIGLLYMNGRFVSVADDPAFVPHLEGLIALSNRVQRFFREWAAVEGGTPPAPFVDLYSPLNFMVTLHTAMMGTSPNFAEQFDANARLLRQLAGQLVETVLADKSSMFGDDDVMRAGTGVATGFAAARTARGLPPRTGGQPDQRRLDRRRHRLSRVARSHPMTVADREATDG